MARSEPFYLTLYWQPTEPLERNYSVGVKVFGKDEQLIAREDSYPGLGAYPTQFWRPGETIVDRYKIWISGRADLPVLGDVWVDLYTRDDVTALPVTTAGGERLSVPRIAHLKVAPPPEPDAPPPTVRFADGIGLDEIAVSPSQVTAGDTITATMTWRPYAAPSQDYTVFVHLVPADTVTEPLAQADAVPRGGAYPTRVWAAGERITDTHHLTAPVDLAAGEYDLLTGVYDADTLQRLPLEGGGDHLRLARLTFDGRQWQVQTSSLSDVVRREGR